jgi:hypothetical protein
MCGNFSSEQGKCLKIIWTSVSVSGQWLAVSWAAYVNYPYTSLIQHADESLGFMKDGELSDLLGGQNFLERSPVYSYIYKVIHKSLRNFRTPLSNNQNRHSRKEHINK